MFLLLHKFYFLILFLDSLLENMDFVVEKLVENNFLLHLCFNHGDLVTLIWNSWRSYLCRLQDNSKDDWLWPMKHEVFWKTTAKHAISVLSHLVFLDFINFNPSFIWCWDQFGNLWSPITAFSIAKHTNKLIYLATNKTRIKMNIWM